MCLEVGDTSGMSDSKGLDVADSTVIEGGDESKQLLDSTGNQNTTQEPMEESSENAHLELEGNVVTVIEEHSNAQQNSSAANSPVAKMDIGESPEKCDESSKILENEVPCKDDAAVVTCSSSSPINTQGKSSIAIAGSALESAVPTLPAIQRLSCVRSNRLKGRRGSLEVDRGKNDSGEEACHSDSELFRSKTVPAKRPVRLTSRSRSDSFDRCREGNSPSIPRSPLSVTAKPEKSLEEKSEESGLQPAHQHSECDQSPKTVLSSIDSGVSSNVDDVQKSSGKPSRADLPYSNSTNVSAVDSEQAQSGATGNSYEQNQDASKLVNGISINNSEEQVSSDEEDVPLVQLASSAKSTPVKQDSPSSSAKEEISDTAVNNSLPTTRVKRQYTRRKPFVKQKKRLSLNLEQRDATARVPNGDSKGKGAQNRRKRKSMGDASQVEGITPQNKIKRAKKSECFPKSSGNSRPLKLAKSFLSKANSKEMNDSAMASKDLQHESKTGDSPMVVATSESPIKMSSPGQMKARKSISPTKKPSRMSMSSPDDVSTKLIKASNSLSPAQSKPKIAKSPASDSKIPAKSRKGPRAKMSLSPNRFNTITIADFFKPVGKSPEAPLSSNQQDVIGASPKFVSKSVGRKKDSPANQQTVHQNMKSKQKLTARKSLEYEPKRQVQKVPKRKSDIPNKKLSAGSEQEPCKPKQKLTARKSGNFAAAASRKTMKNFQLIGTVRPVSSTDVPDDGKRTGRSREDHTISPHAAAKALSALQTGTGRDQCAPSESSDIENNPAMCSGKGAKMPKAKKTFPRSKECSPIDTLDRVQKKNPSANTSSQNSSTGGTPVNAVPMTFNVKELENALGLNRTQLGKLDAKTLDQIVLDRAHEVQGKGEQQPLNKRRKSRLSEPVEQIATKVDDVKSTQVQANCDNTANSDTNFASLLTSQRILKKRRKVRRMGQYKLPGQKKWPKKVTANTTPKAGNDQGKNHQNSSEVGNQDVSDLKLKICASTENGHFTVQKATPSPTDLEKNLSTEATANFTGIKGKPADLKSQSRTPVASASLGKAIKSEHIPNERTSDSERNFIKKKKRRNRRGWASGMIRKNAKYGNAKKKEINIKTENILTNSAENSEREDTNIKLTSRTKQKRDDETESVVSMATSLADSEASSTVSRASRNSKRKRSLKADPETIPSLSPATTPLPIVTRNVNNSEPPVISPQKISAVSLMKPSPKRPRMERAAVGSTSGAPGYSVEGARVDRSGGNGSRRRPNYEDLSHHKYHNTPNGVSYPVTPPRTPEHGSLTSENASTHSDSMVSTEVKGADRGQDFVPVCCCKVPGASATSSLVSHRRTLYCQALDSVNNKIVGCCNKVSKSQMVRPGLTIPFMMVCEMHRQRLKVHQCCPGCGLFCTEGKFVQCKTEITDGANKTATVLHHYHKHCQVHRANKLFCPHCARESKQNIVHLQLNTSHPAQSGDQKAKTSPDKSKADGVETDGQSLEMAESRTARMGNRRHSKDGSTTEEDTSTVAMATGATVVVPATNQVISAKKIPLGPMRSELENALSILEGDRAKKLRAGAKNLYKACRVGDGEKAIVMLADGADPNMRYEEESNQTALHSAAKSGYHLIMHMLLQAGANPHCIDDTLWTPLMFAAQQGHLSLVQILVKSGALVDAKASDGMTSLHLAAQAGNVEIVKFLLQTGRISVNVTDDGGWTSLIWAAEHSHLDVVHYLLQMAADPNIQDNEGNTALHWAAYSGSVDIAEIFLNAGCDLEAVNALGDRPLHIASRQDHYQSVVLFLARGADIEARNNDNESPLGCCVDKDTPVWMALRVNKQLKGFAAKKLHSSEKLLHRDISYGREANPIPVVNIVDDENYPTDFLYVTEHVETAPMNINRTITSLQHCKCQETCGSVFCECSHSSIRCWYEKDGKLVKDFSYTDPPLIFECNKACTCWSTCPNRVIQLGVTCRLQVFRTSGRGWGARSLLDIPQGTFVCEYIGELISDAEADSREDDSYLFDLDNKDVDTFCIDARRYGNVSRFINHICNPNLIPVKVFVDHQDLRFPRICFFASRDIKAYEELGFDYGEKFWIIKWKQFTCTCGSPKCRYSQETIHKTLEDYDKRQAEEEVNLDTAAS